MNSKNKGSTFERKLCSALSLWVSHGECKDLFWRSSMSGGRSTVAHKKGEHVRQAGDICSVSPEGHVLTDWWFIEAKHVRNLKFAQFILLGKGPLASFWKIACKQAAQFKRQPMLIAKQNNMPIMVITTPGALEFYVNPKCRSKDTTRGDCDVYLLAEVLAKRFMP